MTKRIGVILLLAASHLAVLPSVGAQNNQQRGATFGGLAGAIAGGLIGDHNDEAGAGAVIGGVVGAVAGGVLGNAADKDQAIAQQRAAYARAQQQQYLQQQHAAAIQSAVTIQDVISMTRSGLSDQVILNQVRQRGYVGKLAVNDIIALHQQGVSENVITGIQNMGEGPVAVATPAPAVVEHHIHRPAPVIIEEHVVPRYYHPHPHYRRARHTFYFGH
ncbi:glycine zipper domain-containing protein [Roseiconus nitratireducens]|uniref:glycine zipper domain-containing protein n=1 Tax=Roseiconus nitratireducens TaxID=2605748 RepID=UPI001375D065|nr:glycine zipper domain-containing protein [Roseiconus nitratireducens]